MQPCGSFLCSLLPEAPRASARALGLPAALATALLSAGCSDGYPQADSPVLDPFSMTQHQRLAAMNQVGRQAHAGFQWSYTLLPGCTLRIDVDGERGPVPSVDIPLMGAAIDISNDRGRKTYGVQVAPPSGHASPLHPVLQSRDWADVSWMQLLLRVLQKGCDDARTTARSTTPFARQGLPHTTIEE